MPPDRITTVWASATSASATSWSCTFAMLSTVTKRSDENTPTMKTAAISPTIARWTF